MFLRILAEKLAGIVELSPGQAAQLERHYELLSVWNRKLNLTSVSGLEETVERHYCESVFAGNLLPAGRLRIADVGSGAGFPGFPIAVLRPDCSVALIESHARKSVFLREAGRELENLRVIAGRAEAVAEEFDWVVSRAVSYEDLRPSLKRLSRNADLLTGAQEPSGIAEFQWDPPVLLPWGRQRFVRLGHRRT